MLHICGNSQVSDLVCVHICCLQVVFNLIFVWINWRVCWYLWSYREAQGRGEHWHRQHKVVFSGSWPHYSTVFWLTKILLSCQNTHFSQKPNRRQHFTQYHTTHLPKHTPSWTTQPQVDIPDILELWGFVSTKVVVGLWVSKRITNPLSNFTQLLETWISSRFQNVSQQSFKPSDLVEIVNRWSIRCNNSQRKPDHENTRLLKGLQFLRTTVLDQLWIWLKSAKFTTICQNWQIVVNFADLPQCVIHRKHILTHFQFMK